MENRSKASHVDMLVSQVHAHDQSSECASVLCTDLAYRSHGDQQYVTQAFTSLQPNQAGQRRDGAERNCGGVRIAGSDEAHVK